MHHLAGCKGCLHAAAAGAAAGQACQDRAREHPDVSAAAETPIGAAQWKSLAAFLDSVFSSTLGFELQGLCPNPLGTVLHLRAERAHEPLISRCIYLNE
jgi:hypothetical protein